MNKEEMIALGADIAHWPTHEKYQPLDPGKEWHDGDIVGIIYNTSEWPVPAETYHPDNWMHWNEWDPNRPAITQKEETEREIMMQKFRDLVSRSKKYFEEKQAGKQTD